MVRVLEAECMRVHRSKVNKATSKRALLHQSLAAKEAGIAALYADNSTRFKVGATAMTAPPGPPDNLEAERVQGILEGTRFKGLQKEKLIVMNVCSIQAQATGGACINPLDWVTPSV